MKIDDVREKILNLKIEFSNKRKTHIKKIVYLLTIVVLFIGIVTVVGEINLISCILTLFLCSRVYLFYKTFSKEIFFMTEGKYVSTRIEGDIRLMLFNQKECYVELSRSEKQIIFCGSLEEYTEMKAEDKLIKLVGKEEARDLLIKRKERLAFDHKFDLEKTILMIECDGLDEKEKDIFLSSNYHDIILTLSDYNVLIEIKREFTSEVNDLIFSIFGTNKDFRHFLCKNVYEIKFASVHDFIKCQRMVLAGKNDGRV